MTEKTIEEKYKKLNQIEQRTQKEKNKKDEAMQKMG
jgi:hypothetical protein